MVTLPPAREAALWAEATAAGAVEVLQGVGALGALSPRTDDAELEAALAEFSADGRRWQRATPERRPAIERVGAVLGEVVDPVVRVDHVEIVAHSRRGGSLDDELRFAIHLSRGPVVAALQANHAILIPRNTPHVYWASDSNPWSIYWVHFTGSSADLFAHQLAAGEHAITGFSPRFAQQPM